MIWVSIDGGGSTTHVCACDRNGQQLFDRSFGSSNYKASSRQAVEAHLIEAMTVLLDTLGRSVDSIGGLVAGMAGCDTDIDRAVYAGIFESTGVNHKATYICNDTELAFRARSDSSGLCVVAGTGSIVTAYDLERTLLRMGGWGSPLSDQGSGYWVGSQILSCMIRFLDGMSEEKLEIYSEIETRYRMPGVELQWQLAELSTQEVASLTPLVFQHANRGDEACERIVRSSIRLIVELVVTAYHKAAFTEPCSIVTVGGLFDDKHYRASVIADVEACLGQHKVSFFKASGSPAQDGLRFARRRFPHI